jgi:energy-coupling factor transporter ATP-binding protein EcfA2
MPEFEITTSRTGEQKFKLSRINVFLGANGTGKSKLLEELRGQAQSFLPDYTPLNIEGGRAVQMYDSLELNNKNFNQYRTFEQCYNHYRNGRLGTLTNRLFSGLKALEQMGVDAKINHSDEVVAWTNNSKEGPEPAWPKDPMKRVFEAFNEIFPAIKLRYRRDSRRLICRKNGNEYGPTSLSDGEKQVFSILVDITELAEQKSVLFVDEPELNLNPALSNRMWASIESLLPDAVFIYATHSVNFAMRHSIDHLIVLSHDNESISELTGTDELSLADQRELLGNIPALVAYSKTLVVEGHDESFDSIFYHWLIDKVQFAPAAVGGSGDVVAIASREGKWQKISPEVQLTGIIDRDFKSDETVEQVSGREIVVLDLHEAESYLCSPTIICKLAERVAAVDPLPTEAELKDIIFDQLQVKCLHICANRVIARLTARVSPSISSGTMRRVTSIAQLETLFLTDVKSQLERVDETFTEENVKTVIADEHANLERIINDRDLDAALKVIPGKELLDRFVSKVGVVDANALARAARGHLKAKDFELTHELRVRLIEALKRDDEEPVTEAEATAAEAAS